MTDALPIALAAAAGFALGVLACWASVKAMARLTVQRCRQVAGMRRTILDLQGELARTQRAEREVRERLRLGT